VLLARLVRDRRPRTLFEIGTFDGRTTLNLAANAPDEAIVYTLDLPATEQPVLALASGERTFVDKPTSGARVHRSELAPKVKQLLGDSATFDFSPYVSAVDFVFVDGSHAYENALNDSRIAHRLLRNGKGTIVWHDYDVWPGVSNALHQLRATSPVFHQIRWIEGTSLAVLDVA
jgi:predicted O-methyltransferase YrrM